MKKGDFHLDDIKIVPYSYSYVVSSETFTKKFNTLPITLGNEKKYWWGVNENYSSNFKFTSNSNSTNSNESIISKDFLSELDVFSSLSVDYNSQKKMKSGIHLVSLLINGNQLICLKYIQLQP